MSDGQRSVLYHCPLCADGCPLYTCADARDATGNGWEERKSNGESGESVDNQTHEEPTVFGERLMAMSDEDTELACSAELIKSVNTEESAKQIVVVDEAEIAVIGGRVKPHVASECSSNTEVTNTDRHMEIKDTSKFNKMG